MSRLSRISATSAAILLSAFATGCGTNVPAGVPVAPASVQATPKGPAHATHLDERALRHLLTAGNSSAHLWGLRYNSSSPVVVGAWANAGNRSSLESAGYSYDAPMSNYFYTYLSKFIGWSIDWSHTGAGDFEAIGHRGSGRYDVVSSERFVYSVPANQVLVINEVEGSLSINGFDVSSGVREKVHYLFGSGEVVQFSMSKGAWADGYDADPALFSGASVADDPK